MPSKTKDKKEIQSPPKSNAIVWVVVGCLGFAFIFGILIMGIFAWGIWRITNYNFPFDRGDTSFHKNIKVYPPEDIYNLETARNANQNSVETNDNFSETPVEGVGMPLNTEKNMGYLTKVYVKNGKNFLDIDYVQWLTGEEAQKAMREDGECPTKGECIVYDDYYIRNQNPLVRTFEVSPDVDIRMQTLDSETTGQIDQNRKISFEKLESVFAPGSSYKERYRFTPFIIEISNKKIVKITEQYVP